MLYKVAEIITEIPAAGGLATRCKAYLWDEKAIPDIVIREEDYRPERYDARIRPETVAYMESAYQFYRTLVDFDGFYLHASAVVLEGKAYLFSGPSRAGKSTHTRLWQSVFGPEAHVINDDKPALRLREGKWYAYGTPWCGKDGINENTMAPLAGVCFLKKGEKNSIRSLDAAEAMQKILSQTIYKFEDAEKLDRFLKLLEHFLGAIPVYELENRPEEAAARLSHDTMHRGAEEMGL